MRTFDNLIFETEVGFFTRSFAKMDFPNGYGISVVLGEQNYSNGVDTYEVAVLKGENICYDTAITDDVMGWQDTNEVTEIMKQIQNLKR